jgi:uncharacterized protein (TIGR02145 family)
LPTTSINGVTGTWSPALNNTITTTYTFTPTAGLCANTSTMTITVNPIVTPTFTAVASSCANATMTALPTTSNNSISGTWSPALNNTTSTTYTFTPTAGQCANTTTQTITITAPKVTSAISFVAPVAALPSITIGTQVWTNKNLDVTTYRDGTPIPQVTDPNAWVNLTTGAWCYYNNDPANGVIYGKLYNWYAVAGIHDTDPNTPNKILAPLGWHVPTKTETKYLIYSAGGYTDTSNPNCFDCPNVFYVAGGNLKEIGISHWNSQNIGATNLSGFTAFGSGSRDNNGVFIGIGIGFRTWTSTAEPCSAWSIGCTNINLEYWNFCLGNNSTNAELNRFGVRSVGYSVRLIKD